MDPVRGDTGTRRILAVSAATRSSLPAPCIDCVFWQHRTAVTDAGRKERWVRRVEGGGGVWGRLISSGEGTEGMIQYGPADLFPRARRLPAGPPSRDAALVTCVFLAGEDPAGTYERLALECLADLKARGTEAVEAFATSPDDSGPPLGHHTLLDRALLERLGFEAKREHGSVALMRLRLGGLSLVPAERPGLLARLGLEPPQAPATPLAP